MFHLKMFNENEKKILKANHQPHSEFLFQEERKNEKKKKNRFCDTRICKNVFFFTTGEAEPVRILPAPSYHSYRFFQSKCNNQSRYRLVRFRCTVFNIVQIRHHFMHSKARWWACISTYKCTTWKNHCNSSSCVDEDENEDVQRK